MEATMKKKIKDFALELGVDDVGFAAASDYDSPLTPALDTIFPGARTLIVMAYREASHCESGNMRIAMNGRLGIMEFMKSCDYKLSRFLERECGARAMVMPMSYPSNISPESRFGLIGDFSHRHAAIAAGLGNWGRHNLVVHPKLGARVLFSTILSDIELPADPPVTQALCTNCNLCVKSCPGGALDEEGKTDPMKCLVHSQPYGIGGNIRFWTRFIDAAPDEQKKMMRSPEYMRLYQAAFIGYQYHCFACYAACPMGR
jgi:epoxyqueuosine reductase QueG